MFKHRSIVTAIALSIGNPLASADLTYGLVAYYPFNGNALDASGNGNNGTVYGATLTADRFGNANSAYSFDEPSIINTPLANEASNWSISAWINPLTIQNWPFNVFYDDLGYYGIGHSIVNSDYAGYAGTGFGIDLDEMRIIYNSNWLSFRYSFSINNWYNIVIVFDRDGNTVSAFVNGLSIGTNNVSFNSSSKYSDFVIGNLPMAGDWGVPFNGKIDDIRIYNRALSAAEITELYQENTTHQLTITKTGPGNGIVTSNPTGINCGGSTGSPSDCSENYASGTSVTLTATPTAGSIFSGFSGNADCVDQQLTMNAAKTCIATFNLPPTATTGAAANVTQTSATLNGSVTSAGATATATFDLGTTTTYGTSIAATPAQVYSSSAVAVSANKTGLTCGTTYHYRVKAVNSVGTSYGVDKAFTTAACNAWLYPVTMNLPRDREFNLNVTAKSDGMYITNYEFVITYDPTKLSLVYSHCDNGVCPGANALNTNSVYLVGTNAVKIIGLGGQTAANNDLQLLIIKFKTKTTLGITNVELKTNSLINTSGDNIGLESRGAAINISSGICGDADGNNVVNIVDALAVARKVVGLPPPPTIEPLWADVNKDNNVTIIDALMIARYSVGLVLSPEVCNIGQPL